MKTLATWAFAPWLNNQGSHGWHSTAEQLACACASIAAINKHYSRPTVYTDTLGKEILSSITDLADFVVVYDDLYKTIPTNLWAYAKILTYAAQTEPYLHFDLDFIVRKPISIDDCDVMCQVMETMCDPRSARTLHKFYNLGALQYLDLPDCLRRQPEEFDKIACPNLGIFYCKDMALNRDYTQTAEYYVRRNLNHAKVLEMTSVEQQTLGVLLADRPHLKIKTLMRSHWDQYPYDDNFVHFVGQWKQRRYPGVINLQDNTYGSYRDPKLFAIAHRLDAMKKH